MTVFAGLDVSDKTTHICVMDGEGAVLLRDVQASAPDVLAKWLSKHCPVITSKDGTQSLPKRCGEASKHRARLGPGLKLRLSLS
jgi:hypothetical protein